MEICHGLDKLIHYYADLYREVSKRAQRLISTIPAAQTVPTASIPAGTANPDDPHPLTNNPIDFDDNVSELDFEVL